MSILETYYKGDIVVKDEKYKFSESGEPLNILKPENLNLKPENWKCCDMWTNSKHSRREKYKIFESGKSSTRSDDFLGILM
jgi:hypothetical protein